MQPIPDQVPSLSRPVEQQAVVSPPRRRRGVREIHLLNIRVIPIRVDNRRPWLLSPVGVDEISRQRRALERNLHRLNRRLAPLRRAQKHLLLRRERLVQPLIHRIPKQRQIRRSVICRRPEIRFPHAYPVFAALALFADPGHAIRCCLPFAMPVVHRPAIAHPRYRRYALTQVRPAIQRKRRSPKAERLPHRITAENRHSTPAYSAILQFLSHQNPILSCFRPGNRSTSIGPVRQHSERIAGR
jgi:hypothetical protein